MKKIFSILLAMCMLSTVFAVDVDSIANSAFDKEAVESGLTEFVTALADSAPAATTMSNVWADGYVGQLIGIPPHFGVGASAGASKLDISGIKKAGVGLGIKAIEHLGDDFVLPVASIEAVVGGVFIPFDLSASFFTVSNPIGFAGENSLQYQFDSFNVKLRVPLLKQNVILPNLSVGLGYAQVKGAFSVGIANSDVKANSSLNTTFATSVYSVDAQLSKSIIFLTPYVGARLLLSQSDNTWEYSYNVADYASDKNNGGYKTEEMDVSYQLFAGTSFNILVVKLNVNAAIDLKTKVWSAGIGAQVKL